jgi:hypothetical protein
MSALGLIQWLKIIMTGLKLIPLTFFFEIDSGVNCVMFYILGCCRLNFIVLDGILSAGHQKKDRNHYCICLVMNVPKHYPSQKHSPERKIWVPVNFLQTKKLLKAFRKQLKMLKSILGKGLTFAKKISTLVSLWVTNNIKGENY